MLKMPKAPILPRQVLQVDRKQKVGVDDSYDNAENDQKYEDSEFFFMGLSCGAGRQMHYCLLAELRTIENSGNASLVHYGNTITNAEHLLPSHCLLRLPKRRHSPACESAHRSQPLRQRRYRGSAHRR